MDGGLTWTDPAPLNTNAETDTGADWVPQITAGADGTWIAVWDSDDSLGGTLDTDHDILLARSEDGGWTWSDPLPLNTNAGEDRGDDERPQVVTDGTGTWLAIWQSTDKLGDTLGSDWDILFARSTDDGRSWSAPAPLNSNAATNGKKDAEPRIATDGRKVWLAVWQSKDQTGGIRDDYDILTARSLDDGVTWSKSVALNSGAGSDGDAHDYTPVIATDSLGLWITVWARTPKVDPEDWDGSDLDPDLWFSRSTDDGQTWSRRERLHRNNDAEEWWPELATDGRGTWAAVWFSKAAFGGINKDWDILIVRSATDGTTWTDREALNTNATTDKGQDRFPHIAADGSGDWVTLWESDDSFEDAIGDDFDILFSTNTVSQTTLQQKCTNDQNKQAAKLARGQEKRTVRCAKALAKSPGASFQACLDEKPPRAKRVKSCEGVDDGGVSAIPEFGYAPPETLREAALDAPVRLATDLFGPDLDTAFPPDDRAASACQTGVLKAAHSLYGALWKELLKAKKSVLAGKNHDKTPLSPPRSADELGDDLVSWLAEDPKGRIARSEEMLPGRIEKACRKTQPPASGSALFPGTCADTAGRSPSDLATCVAARTRCRFCEQLNETDALALDCDGLDDALANDSCLVPES
jgi:hypothetical protein